MLNLLYGKENFDKMNNANMLDATIELIYFLMYCYVFFAQIFVNFYTICRID